VEEMVDQFSSYKKSTTSHIQNVLQFIMSKNFAVWKSFFDHPAIDIFVMFATAGTGIASRAIYHKTPFSDF
jgi:hypothetical protein